MRALRVLGLAEDGEHLVCEEPTSGEQFALPADEKLRAAARGDVSRFGQLEIEMQPQLRPREIQARIRAGSTVEQVAAAAGCAPERIEGYAYPVLLERSSVTARARLARPVIAGSPAKRTVEEIVADTLAERGQGQAVSWDAFREQSTWVLTLRWRAGRSENRAQWAYHPGADGGTLTPRDDAAAEIVDPAPRPLRTIRSEGEPAVTMPSAVTGPNGSPQGRNVTNPNPSATLPAGRASMSAPASSLPGQAPSGQAPSGRALSEQARPAAENPATQQTGEQVVADTVTDERAGVLPASASAEVARTGTEHASGRSGKRGQRPPMPSWEDVLLGTRSSGR